MYEDAIKLLTSKGKFYVDLGLDRIKSALEKFDNPQNDLKIDIIIYISFIKIIISIYLIKLINIKLNDKNKYLS